jgi:hypothetical protein
MKSGLDEPNGYNAVSVGGSDGQTVRIFVNCRVSVIAHCTSPASIANTESLIETFKEFLS